ncbi:hypothetical protein CFELI_04930 [Corynebacterium felinum]|nr:hypothetical protein CFELI_04930 [Corynebacterium felinum]
MRASHACWWLSFLSTSLEKLRQGLSRWQSPHPSVAVWVYAVCLRVELQALGGLCVVFGCQHILLAGGDAGVETELFSCLQGHHFAAVNDLFT